MESCPWNGTESISTTAFLPFEPDLLKDAEISNATERHLWNGAEFFVGSNLDFWDLQPSLKQPIQKYLGVISPNYYKVVKQVIFSLL